jgi:hypothetical protein
VDRVASKRAHGKGIAAHLRFDGARSRDKPGHFVSIARRELAIRGTGKLKKRRCRHPVAHYVSKKPHFLSNAPPRELSVRKDRLSKPGEMGVLRRNRVSMSSEGYFVSTDGE